MTKNQFIEFIAAQTYLGDERKNDLIQNVDWMTAEERSSLAKQIEEAGQIIEKNNQLMLDKLSKTEQALQQFKREELPKLAKAEEGSEHRSEQEKAEQLLQNL